MVNNLKLSESGFTGFNKFSGLKIKQGDVG
jgi:hypothetical protein